jgi:ankyrin repeat protein
MSRFVVLLPFAVLLSGCGGWGFSVASNKDLRTPLERAAQEGAAAEVKRLLASGADPNDRGGVFGSALTAAAWRERNVEVIRILLAAGAKPNGRGKEGDRCWADPLSNAASMGDIENARVLLDAGASINQPRCSTLTVGWLRAPVIDLLVAHGLNLNAVDENGRNELHLALAAPVVSPHEGIEYLVRAGVPLNARDRRGKTPLAYWREPRYFETHWFMVWLIERVSSDPDFRRQRDDRARISTFLARSGATL